MKERYSRVFTSQQKMYAQGSPIIITAGALLLDKISKNLIAQLKFHSVSELKIKALSVELTPYDTAGRVLGECISHQYLDLCVSVGDEFGSKEPIFITDNTTRSFSARVTEVIFDDNSIWNSSDATWEPIAYPERKTISPSDHNLLYQFKLKYGIAYTQDFQRQKDLWYCPCGAVNKTDVCYKCSTRFSTLEEIDYEALKNECNTRLGTERLKAEQEAEKTLQKKRRKKICRITAIIAICMICAVAVYKIYHSTVVIPNQKYNDAIALMDSGDIVKAYEALIALDGYKDSTRKAASIYNEYKLRTAKVGEHIVFGKYDQDNNTYDGKEDIKWRVLERNGDKILVISEYALDSQYYHKNYYSADTATWETCSLRRWLNNDFLYSAFSADEIAKIDTVTIATGGSINGDADVGNETQDKVFLLSVAEAEKYFSYDRARECSHTHKSIVCSWFLRSPDAYVSVDGKVITGSDIRLKRYVRPAMWISLE